MNAERKATGRRPATAEGRRVRDRLRHHGVDLDMARVPDDAAGREFADMLRAIDEVART